MATRHLAPEITMARHFPAALPTRPRPWDRLPWLGALAGLLVLGLAGLVLWWPTTASAEGARWVAGISASDEATAAQVGLPDYPGAQRVVDPSDRGNKDAVALEFRFGNYGLEVVVAKFTTPDSAEAVARFYQPALARYGRVLDCQDPAQRAQAKAAAQQDDQALTCDDKPSRTQERVYKVGTEHLQRALSIERQAEGRTVFSLVRVVIKS
jgi:hypothetical protein